MVSIKFRQIDDFPANAPDVKQLRGIHSGNAGDVIFSLPAVRVLGIRHLILNVYRDPNPLRHLTEKSARALVPLLLAQDYIDRVTIVAAGVPLESVDPECIDVDYVLDRFRNEDTQRVHLMHAHANALHVEIDPNAPFLTIPDGEAPSNDLVLALTPRYRALTDDFVREMLLYFDDILILALPEEWRTIAGIPGRVRQCTDFLEMARLIQGAGVFIGNPSLAAAIAEGLKVPRLIDLPIDPPNAFPIGPRGYVIPSTRQEFVDIVQRACGDRPRLSALYSDLLSIASKVGRDRWLTTPVEPLRLIGGADPPQPSLDGGGWTKLSSEENGLFLHPAPSGALPPRAVFEGLQLAGHNCFRAELSIAHPDSEPVRFVLCLKDENGAVIHEATRDLQGLEQVQWHVVFPRQFSKATLELSTTLPPGSQSADFAWAWVRDPELLAI